MIDLICLHDHMNLNFKSIHKSAFETWTKTKVCILKVFANVALNIQSCVRAENEHKD